MIGCVKWSCLFCEVCEGGLKWEERVMHWQAWDSIMEVGPSIHPLIDCISDVHLEFFGGLVISIREECLESLDLDMDIHFELRVKLPGFSVDQRIG